LGIHRELTREEQEITLGIVAYLSDLNGVYFSNETVLEIYWTDPTYKDLFFYDEEDNLSASDEETLKDFVNEVHKNEIRQEFNRMSDEGICEQGVDSEGNIIYYPTGKLSEKELVQLALDRLESK